MVLALVGFRKIMDFFPTKNKPWFSQNDLFWLDNLMPSSNDKKSDDSEENSKTVSFLGKGHKKLFFSISKKLMTVDGHAEILILSTVGQKI